MESIILNYNSKDASAMNIINSIRKAEKAGVVEIVENIAEVEDKEAWLKEFLEIPAAYRCNPFDVSPSGDLFFADKRNVDKVKESVEEAKNGKTIKIKTKQELHQFLDLL